jgi:serine protease
VLGGESGDLSVADAARTMIDRANRNGQRLVINLSLGVPKSFGVKQDQELEQVIRDNPNVLFVTSAGNFGHLGREGIGSNAVLAGSYSNVMAIGAVWGTQDYNRQATTPGARIEYSNWWGSQYGEGLTVMAPSEVIAPVLNTENGTAQFDYNAKFGGTSAAAPNAAGVASLVLSANPYLSAAQVKQILSQTAVDVGQPGYDKLTGAGVVNADAAVRRAMAISRGFVA